MELTDFTVIESGDGDKTLIKIHNIFFHPQGGGQPNDKLFDESHNPIEIIKEKNDIFLEVESSKISDGKINIFIDEDYRLLCSKLHSAGHLLALTTTSLYDIAPIKAHHFPGECYVKFSGLISEQEKSAILKKISEHTNNDNPVTVTDSEGMRVVTFDGIGGYPCGGTHVNSLKEIGSIDIISISNKKGNTTIKYSLVN